MNRIEIEESDRHTVIEIRDDNKICGNTFYKDGRIEPITMDTLSIFKSFILSKNNKPLPNEGEYNVVLDNETGFKHYFLNGKEDYEMLFLNNGEEDIMYREEKHYLEDNGWEKEKKPNSKFRLFRIDKKVIKGNFLCLFMLIVSMATYNTASVVLDSRFPYIERPFPIIDELTNRLNYNLITVEELMGLMKSSKKLSEEDYNLLATKEYYEDILPYINTNVWTRYCFRKKFRDVYVQTYDGTKSKAGGYYSSCEPNSLFVAEEYVGTEYYKSIISHEDNHRCQLGYSYNLLAEAAAEIESFEYRDIPESSYKEERLIVKKLMEIIGPEPVACYIHSGYFDEIEKAVKPYFTEEEYNDFLSLLSQPDITSPNYDRYEIHHRHNRLDSLLVLLYERKYGRSVSEDPVLPYIRFPDLKRYYFNDRKKELEGSYLISYDVSILEIELKEAVEKNYISIRKHFGDDLIAISYDDFINEPDKGSIEFISNDIVRFFLYTSNDGKFMAHIVSSIDEKRIEFPQVEDKIRDLENDSMSKNRL